ncbi:MAG: RNA polymerase sigma factor [Lachnospiraceae bacterium]
MAAKSGKITEEIINAEYQAVYHYILSLCRDEKEAEYITQDTFVKAISTESFRGESSYYSWLCSIGRNIWIDKCRKSGILQFEEMPEEALPAASESPPLEEVIADGELLRQVHRIIHKMDEPYKEVFTLKVFGDLSFKDISFLFGKTESWARVT